MWDRGFSRSVLLPVLESDHIPSRSLSVTDERQHADNLTDLFDGVTYHKSYLNAVSFSNAIQDDLWHHFQKVIETYNTFDLGEELFLKVIDEQNDLQLPAPVKVIMDSWTCQFGFPVLTINLTTGEIKQQQFNNAAENDTKTHKYV
ncbi:hypothetical protein lerEdw1_000262 [Lerista edwardsae]|nr:hypothetical protein lerEdw1_000262 [Lerista edwardsae]